MLGLCLVMYGFENEASDPRPHLNVQIGASLLSIAG
jgi:hypothetical protein